jgi:hypothetical protein
LVVRDHNEPCILQRAQPPGDHVPRLAAYVDEKEFPSCQERPERMPYRQRDRP